MAECWEALREGWTDERVRRWINGVPRNRRIPEMELVPYRDDEVAIAGSAEIERRDSKLQVERALEVLAKKSPPPPEDGVGDLDAAGTTSSSSLLHVKDPERALNSHCGVIDQPAGSSLLLSRGSSTLSNGGPFAREEHPVGSKFLAARCPTRPAQRGRPLVPMGTNAFLFVDERRD